MDNFSTLALDSTLPAMLLRLWGEELPAWPPGEEAGDAGLESGVLRLRHDLLAVLAVGGDAAVVEVACHTARRLFQTQDPSAPLAALILPGEVSLASGDAVLRPNPMMDDLDHSPPELEDRAVYLTGHAAHELENRWSLLDSGNYQGASGRECPLWQLAESRYDLPPWRNPELLGRSLPTIARPNLFTAISRNARYPALRVSGPLGCGKTRAVREVFQHEPHRSIWARTWSRRSGGPCLAKQFLGQLLTGPWRGAAVTDPALLDRGNRLLDNWWGSESAAEVEALGELLLDLLGQSGRGRVALICDELEKALPADQELVNRLLDSKGLGSTFQLILLDRGGKSPTRWQELPQVEMSPWGEREMTALGAELFQGLSLPMEHQERFIQACQGFPFALEEGVLQLIRRKLLRRLYGNFFYTGGRETDYEPSFRLIRHLDAEVRRLGESTPLRVLALAQTAVPQAELAKTSVTLGKKLPDDWTRPFLKAGLLATAESPWGAGLAFACDAFRVSLASTLTEPSSESPRHTLGGLLAGLKGDNRSAWHAYLLLKGSPDAVSPLVQTSRRPSSGVSREELFEALLHELERHQERRGDSGTELELLWSLLPLARRMGRLRGLSSAIDRALELAREVAPERYLALTALKAESDVNQGDFQAAERSILQGLELAQGTNERRKALLCIQLGSLLERQERYRDARKLFEDLLATTERTGSASLAATCRFHLGNVALHENRIGKARQFHEQAYESRRAQGVLGQLGSSLTALGTVRLAMGDYERALGYFLQAREVLEEHGREGEVSFALVGLGRVLSRLGDFVTASSHLKKALAFRQDRDDTTGEALARLEVAENLLNLGQSEAALADARQAHFRLSLTHAVRHLGDADQLLGRILLQQQQFEEAEEHFRNAIRNHQDHGSVLPSTFDRAWLLEAALAQGKEEEVRSLCSDLEVVLKTLHYPELGEMLDLRLHLGLAWLRREGDETVDPIPPLSRAYQELYRKTSLLSSKLRNPFLYLIPDNRAILDAATHQGLSLPVISVPPPEETAEEPD